MGVKIEHKATYCKKKKLNIVYQYGDMCFYTVDLVRIHLCPHEPRIHLCPVPISQQPIMIA